MTTAAFCNTCDTQAQRRAEQAQVQQETEMTAHALRPAQLNNRAILHYYRSRFLGRESEEAHFSEKKEVFNENGGRIQ